MVYIAPVFSIDEEVGLNDSTVNIRQHRLYLGSPPRAGPNFSNCIKFGVKSRILSITLIFVDIPTPKPILQ